MNIKYFFFILLLATVPLAMGDDLSTAGKTTITFLGFEAKDIPESGNDILSDLVRDELIKSQKYTVLDRQNKKALLEEMNFQSTGITEEKTAVSLGKMLGVEKIITGTIGELGKLYLITLKMIDVESGTIEKIETEEFTGSMENLRRPVRIVVQKLLDIEGIEVDRGTFINVTSDPAGVNIYIDGLFEGSSPAKVKVPGEGEYHVKLYSPEYEEWHQKINVKDNSTFFVNAKLLKKTGGNEVDERIKALQDGRTSFIITATAFSFAATEALIYASGTDNDRLYFGLPLLVTPASFFTALKGTTNAVMNNGRSFMITSSILWGITMGLTSGIVMYNDIPEEETADYWRPFSFASAAGGLLYGTAATLLTRGDAFPSSRVWFINLGSFMGSLVGLGIPYMFNVESRPLLFGSMLAGSTVGGGLAIYLTRYIPSHGANVENLSFSGSLIEINGKKLSAGIPLPVPETRGNSGTPGVKITLFHYLN